MAGAIESQEVDEDEDSEDSVDWRTGEAALAVAEPVLQVTYSSLYPRPLSQGP